MIYTCDICEKSFKREEHFIRHNARKTPCYKNLSCFRCGRDFNLLGDLNRHLARKNPCEDKRKLLELELLVEQEKTKQKDKDIIQEEIKLKQEKQKTIQAKLNQGNAVNINIQNVFGDNISFINNIDEISTNMPLCKWEAEQLIETNNVEKTFDNLVKFAYINKKHPKDQCLIQYKGELYSKLNDIVVEFKKAKLPFNNKLKKIINMIEYEYGPFSEDEMYIHGVNQRFDHIEESDINTIKKVDTFLGNIRNNKSIENIVRSSLC
jgi:hypothetical protein